MSQFREDPKSNQSYLSHPHSESSEPRRSDGIPPYQSVQRHLQTHFEDPSKPVKNVAAHGYLRITECLHPREIDHG